MLCLDPPRTWKIYNIPILYLEFSFDNYQQQLFHKHHLSTMTYQLCYPPNLLPFQSCISEFHFPMLICLHCSLSSLISSVAFAGQDALPHFVQSNSLIQTEFLPNTSKSETHRLPISAIMSSRPTNIQSFGWVSLFISTTLFLTHCFSGFF